jgi:hypothetical protein
MTQLIDTDLHNIVPDIQALLPYLSVHWREYISQSAFKGPVDTAYPPALPTSAHPDTRPANGDPPGSSLTLLRQQVLDALDVELGILNCPYAVESLHNPDAAVALAKAT